MVLLLLTAGNPSPGAAHRLPGPSATGRLPFTLAHPVLTIPTVPLLIHALRDQSVS